MTLLPVGVVDCDVHVEPASIDVVKKYLSSYWVEYLRGAGRVTLSSAGLYPPNVPLSALPEARAAGSFPPQSYEQLKTGYLDRVEPEIVILNCIATFLAGRNPYYEAAVARAVNEWVRDEWLDRNERLRASIIIPALNPDAAAEEIERLAPDPRFVQVLLPVRSETPWGNLRWKRIHEAAADAGRPLAFHAWGDLGSSPTTMGYSHTFYEDYVSISQVTAPTQLMSLIAEGVFDRLPSLNVVLVECGFNWLPPLMWQFDKDWKSLWREVPWMKRRPSEYIRSHVRATTSPSHLDDVAVEQVAQLAEMLGASEMLMYSSDYPHDHGDGGFETVLGVLGESGRASVFRGNADLFYGLKLGSLPGAVARS